MTNEEAKYVQVDDLLRKIGADINNLTPEGKTKGYRDGVSAVWTIIVNRFMEESEDQSDEAKHMAIKTLKQEPKIGHWIRKTNEYGASSYVCSECGKWHPVHVHCLGFDYCNGCGKKMEREE